VKRSAPLWRSPMRRRYRVTGPDQQTRDIVRARHWGRCEICDTGQVEHVHHRLPRGIGSSRDPRINRPSNLLAVCADCHRYVEQHRAEALTAGWLVSRWDDPARVPVLIERGARYVHLADDGSYRLDPPERVA